MKIGPLGNLEVLNPNSDLVFWNSDRKTHFWGNLGQKSQSYQFCLKIGTIGIWRMLILTSTLVFWMCNPKSIFGLIWVKKIKIVYFGWKLAHRASWGCWFFWISYPKFIFGQIWTEKAKSSLFCLKISVWGISRMLILAATLVFWISIPKSIFGQIWAEKVKAVSFAWKLTHTVSQGCWFLFWC